jgi:hypothetical protein
MRKKFTLTEETILSKIYIIRGKRSCWTGIWQPYRVKTGNLNKAVSRNLSRFPSDFMFRLNRKECQNLMFQIGISSWGGTRKLPLAFTENGVAMLSGILNSDHAIMTNVHIIRVFTRMRNTLMTHKDILLKLEQLEKETLRHGGDIKLIFDLLKELLDPPVQPHRKIGFRQKGATARLLQINRSYQ